MSNDDFLHKCIYRKVYSTWKINQNISKILLFAKTWVTKSMFSPAISQKPGIDKILPFHFDLEHQHLCTNFGHECLFLGYVLVPFHSSNVTQIRSNIYVLQGHFEKSENCIPQFKGIFSDSNSTFLWQKSEDINRKTVIFQNFSSDFSFTSYAWLCALALLHRLLC